MREIKRKGEIKWKRGKGGEKREKEGGTEENKLRKEFLKIRLGRRISDTG